MGPRLLCGLASCAALLIIMPGQAKDAAPLNAARASDQAPDGDARFAVKFRERVAAILSEKPVPTPRGWSDIDRDKLVDQFRLQEGGQSDAQAAAAPRSGFVSKVRRRDDVRGVSFGLDGGSANLGPPVDAAARAAEVVAYQLSEASTCNGLMPGVDCNTIGGDDVSVRLAFAFNF